MSKEDYCVESKENNYVITNSFTNFVRDLKQDECQIVDRKKENFGWLYLFRTVSTTNSNIPIYKVGQTARFNLRSRLSHFQGCQKMSVILYAVLIENHTTLEQFVLKELRFLFENVEGKEFFACANDTLITNRVLIAVAKWNANIHRWKSHTLPPDTAKIAELTAENLMLRDLIGEKGKVWRCVWCNKTFAHNSSWHRHMNQRCKFKNAHALQDEFENISKEKDERIKELENKMDEQKILIRTLQEDLASQKSIFQLKDEFKTDMRKRIRDLEMRLELV